MSTRDSVIEMIRRLPEDATVDDIMYELYVRKKITASLEELDKGKSVPHEEVQKEFARWLE
jgi:predicted transcriptional regulator